MEAFISGRDDTDAAEEEANEREAGGHQLEYASFDHVVVFGVFDDVLYDKVKSVSQ